MGKKCSSALLLLLSILFVFTAACSSGGGSGQEKDAGGQELAGGTESKAAKGRYREEKVDLPFFVRHIFDVQCGEDGNVGILFEDEPGSFHYWQSNDGGRSWEQKELGTEWLPPGYRVVSASFGGENIVLSAGKMSEDPLDEKHAVGEYAYFQMEQIQDGVKVNALQLPLPEPQEENLQSGYGLGQILLSDEGRIYGMFISGEEEDSRYEVICFAPGEHEVMWRQKTNTAQIALYGDKIYLSEYGGAVQVLDAKSGDKLEKLAIPLEANFLNSMDVNTREEKIFYCNKTGVYGTDYHDALRELLVDGKLSCFSDVSYDIKRLCSVEGDVFLLFVQSASGAGMELLRYEFDAEMPARPEHELVVYSLKNNYVLEKMISDFQSGHPEVQMIHEVGMADTAAKEEADAIGILNTEMMAGSGPDVLLLNGLPWESYAQKGMLKDLHSDLASYISGEEGFANLFFAYQTDGAQYAVPISFKIPVVVGEEEKVSHMRSPEDLLAAAEETGNLPAFFRQLYPLREAKGQVFAEFAGSIFTCAISTGSLTSAEPVLILEDFSQPFQFEGIGEQNLNMAGNQNIPVEEGLEGTLELGDRGVVLEGVKIGKVAEGEGGTYRVTAELADGSVSRTGNAVLSITKESKRYCKCVPISALHEERSGYYVIVVKEEKTVLGIKPVAQYVPVTLIEHNDEYAAVEGNISEEDKMIVDANKEIKEGKRVRVAGEWGVSQNTAYLPLDSAMAFSHNDNRRFLEVDRMIKHVILWKLKEEYSKEQISEIKFGIKEGLEGLKGKIPGLLDIKVYTEGLESSNVDVMLDSSFENENALKTYASHPAHVAIADGKVRPFTSSRSCMDYEV